MCLSRQTKLVLVLLPMVAGLLVSCGDGPIDPPDPVATKLAFVTAPPSSAPANEALEPQPVIQLQDATGTAVPTAGVVVTASLEGGTVAGATATTASNGRATFTGLALNATTGARTLHFDAPNLTGLVHPITVQVGAASGLAANSETSQEGVAGLPVAAPPSVKVSDAAGNPLVGVSVTFTAVSGGSTVEGATQVTGADGVATVTAWILGIAPGVNRVSAGVAGISGEVVFSATGALVGEATVQPADIQLAIAGTATAIAPSVKVTEAGVAKAGAIVRFQVEQGDGAVAISETTTDASGVATAGEWTLGSLLGKHTVRVEVPGYAPGPLHVQAWAVGALPVTLMLHAGDGQTVNPGQVLPVAPAVKAQDADGNPIAGFPVMFTLEGAGAGSITGGATSTDVAGVASVGSWTMPLANGTVHLLAAAPPLTGSPVQFEATVFDDTPASIEVVSGAITAQVATAVGVLPRVRVKTIGGDILAGVPVEFAIASGGGTLTGASAVTNAAGEASPSSWTLGTQAGEQRVSAAAGAIPPITIPATATPGPPAAAVVAKGDNQTGPVYNPLPLDPTIRIQDQYGNPTPGKQAIFSVTSGGGQLLQATQISNAAGEVSARWRLGGTIGPNQLTASFPALAIPSLQFAATGAAVASSFNIEIRFVGTPSAAEEAAVDAAVARWRTIIQGDIPDIRLTLADSTCTDNQTAIDEQVDDLLILVDFSNIDGPGSVLGSAGPCAIRVSGSLPAFGTITIDGADAANLAATGELRDVMLHEMGHVLGIGTIWDLKNLLIGASGSNPQYTGLAARQAFHGLGGTQTNVPVENMGGAGTRDSHWRETVFEKELMTGFIGGADNPLSKVTSRSLVDLGYVIDDATADPLGFTLNLRLDLQAARARVPVRRLREQPLTGPVIVIYPDGTTRKVPR